MNIDALRSSFDGGFADPYPSAVTARTGLLAITVADVAYALRLSAIAAIHVDCRLGSVPSKVRSLLGLTTLRNVIIPVLDLGVLLGHRTTPRTCRWLVVAAGDAPLAFAFDALDGQLGVEDPVTALGSNIVIAGRSHRVIDLEEVGRAA